MQIKIYTIPIYGGEKLNDEMNVFLRSKKIIQVDSRMASTDQAIVLSPEGSGAKRRVEKPVPDGGMSSVTRKFRRF